MASRIATSYSPVSGALKRRNGSGEMLASSAKASSLPLASRTDSTAWNQPGTASARKGIRSRALARIKKVCPFWAENRNRSISPGIICPLINKGSLLFGMGKCLASAGNCFAKPSAVTVLGSTSLVSGMFPIWNRMGLVRPLAVWRRSSRIPGSALRDISISRNKCSAI